MASSSPKLCCEIISWAFQRCRLSEDQQCRVSVILKSSLASSSSVLISISDTGMGSCLEEFQDMEFTSDCIRSGKWDGLLSIRTTGFSDDEIRSCQVNLRERKSGRRLTQLPSNLKNGVKFSGTEVCLSVFESMDVLVSEINSFLQKMLVLKIPNITSELVFEREGVPGSRSEYVYPAVKENVSTFSGSCIEHLQSGLEEYVLKHGDSLSQKEHLKVGAASCSSESRKNSGLVMETVVIISEVETASSSSTLSSKTQVLYYEDFKPSSLGRSSMTALSSIDWKSYGLTLRGVIDQDGCLLQWDNLQSNVYISMVLHCYHKQRSKLWPRSTSEPDRCFVKKAVKLAMDNLKERNPGQLLRERTIKIRSYAPDLARSIAGLITSSTDHDFQKECFSLLSMRYEDAGSASVEDCIRKKIIAVVEENDRNPLRSKDVASSHSSSLFGDVFLQDANHGRGEGNRGPLILEDDLFENCDLDQNEFEAVEDEEGEYYGEMDLTN